MIRLMLLASILCGLFILSSSESKAGIVFPRGACCGCAEEFCSGGFSGECGILTEGDCEAFGGTYQGNGETCEPDDPCDDINVGACCGCTEEFCSGGLSGECGILTEGDCEAFGGTYQGNGETCIPIDSCLPTPQGACCGCSDEFCSGGTSGECGILTAGDCNAFGGTYQGNGDTCFPNDPCDEILQPTPTPEPTPTPTPTSSLEEPSGPIVIIPTMGQLGMMFASLIIGIVAVLRIRRISES